MAQGEYKNGEVIEVTYQATGATSGLIDVKMDVYDEGHLIDAPKGVAAMTEIGSTGRYYGDFTPDAEGEWTVVINSIATPGKIVKKYSVVGHNIDSVGDAVATTDGKIDTLDTIVDATAIQVGNLNNVSVTDVKVQADAALTDYDAPTKAELDVTESAIRGADSDTLKSLSDQIDGVGSADSAPMVG